MYFAMIRTKQRGESEINRLMSYTLQIFALVISKILISLSLFVFLFPRKVKVGDLNYLFVRNH